MESRILFFPLLGQKITDLLAEYPQLTTLFMKYQTACIGCGFSSFCNLSDALTSHELDTMLVLKDIQKYTQAVFDKN